MIAFSRRAVAEIDISLSELWSYQDVVDTITHLSQEQGVTDVESRSKTSVFSDLFVPRLRLAREYTAHLECFWISAKLVKPAANIESLYNPERRHQHIGGVSPEVFETTMMGA